MSRCSELEEALMLLPFSLVPALLKYIIAFAQVHRPRREREKERKRAGWSIALLCIHVYLCVCVCVCVLFHFTIPHVP